jgi:tetratricopeptide (TPR) repeat protein
MSLATLCGPWCRYWLADLFVAAAAIGLVLLLRRLGIAYSNRVRAVIQNVGVTVALLIAVTVGFYAVTIAPPLLKHDTANAAQLIALGLLSVGAVIGFLFGLPKVADDSAPITTNTSTPPANGSTATAASGSAAGARLHVNTNLQKVSDWLTTVITGLALTQLLDVPTHIKDLSAYLGGGLGGANPSDGVYAIALGMVLYFPTIGFLLGYIATRTVLTRTFDEVDRSLTFTPDERAKVDALPRLIELPDAPSNDDLAAARKIAQADPTTLTTAEEKAAYARALTLLGKFEQAIPWYQQALALTPNDARLLEQYAFALFDDQDSDAWQMVPVLERALSLSQGDLTAKARITTNLILTWLYVQPDGFVRAIDLANTFIADTSLDKRPIVFFYRACAYGQLYSALKQGRNISGAVPSTDLGVVAKQIQEDTDAALAMAPSLRSQFYLVTQSQAKQPGRDESADDDLASFARDFPAYKQRVCGDTTAPPAAANASDGTKGGETHAEAAVEAPPTNG